MALTIRAWRKARELTVEQTATLLGVHPNTYRNWENAPEKISIENADKICKAFKVSFGDIIFLSENTTKV